MAVVRISEALIHDVRNYINRASYVELAPLEYTTVLCSDTSVAALEKYVWGDYYDLKDRLPDNWCVTDSEYLEIRVRSSDLSTVSVSVHRKYHRLKLPPGTSRYERTAITYDTVAATPELSELKLFLDDIYAKRTAAAEVNVKFEKIKTQVTGFLRSCPSLNAAVKTYPDILLWIPQEYKDRLNKNVQRNTTQSTSAPFEIDKELVTTAGVIHAIQKQ